MLVAALVAFCGMLVALAGAVTLIGRFFEDRPRHLLAWSLALGCLAVGLGAMTLGLVVGFTPVLFRTFEAGASLLGLLALAWGVVELLATSVVTAFAARLFIASYAVVGGVVVAVDPLRDGLAGDTYPRPEELYLQLPLTLLAIAHAVAVLFVLVGGLVAVTRTRRGDAGAWDAFLGVVLAALAALCVLVGTSSGLIQFPVVAYAFMVGLGAALLWFAALRTQEQTTERVEPEPEPERRGRRRRARAAEERPGPPPAPPEPPPQRYGQIVILTLREGMGGMFDRLAEETVREIEANEPETLVYTCHTVAGVPLQRIFYELYHDRVAFTRHERQPYVKRFYLERERYVLATNVVRLDLNAAKDITSPSRAEAGESRAADLPTQAHAEGSELTATAGYGMPPAAENGAYTGTDTPAEGVAPRPEREERRADERGELAGSHGEPAADRASGGARPEWEEPPADDEGIPPPNDDRWSFLYRS